MLEDGINISVRLRVSESKEDVSKEDQELINNSLKNQELAMYLDVSLFKKVGDEAEQKLSVLSDKMELSLELDDKFINKDSSVNRVYKVIRVHDGKVDVIDTKFDSKTNTIYFETDRFSSYALVYEDVPITENPKTNDNIIMYLIIGTVSLVGLSLVNRKRLS